MSLYTMMESVCELQRPTIGVDADDGTTQDPWKTIYTNRACSYQQNSVSEYDLYNQRNTLTATAMYFAANPTCQINDRFKVTEIRTGRVCYVLVVGQAQPVARGRQWSADVKEIPPPT